MTKHEELQNMRRECYTAPSRSQANALATEIAQRCRTYGDVAAIFGQGWVREVLPEWESNRSEIGPGIRKKVIGTLMSIWAGKFRYEAIQAVIREAVFALRKRLRDSGHSLGCHEMAAKDLLLSGLGMPCEVSP